MGPPQGPGELDLPCRGFWGAGLGGQQGDTVPQAPGNLGGSDAAQAVRKVTGQMSSEGQSHETRAQRSLTPPPPRAVRKYHSWEVPKTQGLRAPGSPDRSWGVRNLSACGLWAILCQHGLTASVQDGTPVSGWWGRSVRGASTGTVHLELPSEFAFLKRDQAGEPATRRVAWGGGVWGWGRSRGSAWGAP